MLCGARVSSARRRLLPPLPFAHTTNSVLLLSLPKKERGGRGKEGGRLQPQTELRGARQPALAHCLPLLFLLWPSEASGQTKDRGAKGEDRQTQPVSLKAKGKEPPRPPLRLPWRKGAGWSCGKREWGEGTELRAAPGREAGGAQWSRSPRAPLKPRLESGLEAAPCTVRSCCCCCCWFPPS